MRSLNNIGVSFYLQGNKKAAKKFLRLAMKLNTKVDFPDPALVYNFTLLDKQLTMSSAEIGVKSLLKLKETPQRNLFIFILRIMQGEHFNNDFFKNRKFSSNFLFNETLQNLLEIFYDHMIENPGEMRGGSQIKNMFQIDSYGDILSRYANGRFVCALFTTDKRLLFCIWRYKDKQHYNHKKVNVSPLAH